jgi:MoxR-like ATPase
MFSRLPSSSSGVRAVAVPVIRHRIFTNFNADAEGVNTEKILDLLLHTVPEPSHGKTTPEHPSPPKHGPAAK